MGHQHKQVPDPSEMSAHGSLLLLIVIIIISSPGPPLRRANLGGIGCLLTRALARHDDKHSLRLPVSPRKLQIILIISPHPSVFTSPAGGDGVTALPRDGSNTLNTARSANLGKVLTAILRHSVQTRRYVACKFMKNNYICNVKQG